MAPTSISIKNNTNNNINTNANANNKVEKRRRTSAVPDYECKKRFGKAYDGRYATRKKSCMKCDAPETVPSTSTSTMFTSLDFGLVDNYTTTFAATDTATTDTPSTNRTTATSSSMIMQEIQQKVGPSYARRYPFEIALGSYFIDTPTFMSQDSALLTLSFEAILRRQASGQIIIATATQSVMATEEGKLGQNMSV